MPLPRAVSADDLVLRAGDLALRPLTAADATETYVAWLNDPQINRFLEVRHSPQTVATVRAYIERHDGKSGFLFGIFAADGRHIGNLALKLDSVHKTGSMGVIVGDTAYWGRNVVLPARARVLDFAFATLGLHKVTGACYSNNLPAVFNYRSQGWTLEGIEKERFFSDDKRVDNVMFAMFARDWAERKRR